MSITILTGCEDYLINKYINDYKAFIEHPEFNISIFNDYDESALLEACEQLPFMSDKRLVLCYGDVFKGDSKNLCKYCDNPVPSTELLIIGGVDKRKKIYKQIEKHGSVKIFNKLNASKYNEFLYDYLLTNDANVSKEVVDLIVQRTLYLTVDDVYLYDVVSNLDKLIDFAGGRGITIEMVQSIIKPPIDSNVFKLIGYIVKKDKKAINYATNLLENGAEVMQLLGLLLRHYRILYKYRVAGSEGLGLVPFQLNEFKQSKLSDREALRAMELITAAQDNIKSGKVDMRFAFDVLIVQLLY